MSSFQIARADKPKARITKGSCAGEQGVVHEMFLLDHENADLPEPWYHMKLNCGAWVHVRPEHTTLRASEYSSKWAGR